eukprot:427159-Karenia_brevis.AAC.1
MLGSRRRAGEPAAWRRLSAQRQRPCTRKAPRTWKSQRSPRIGRRGLRRPRNGLSAAATSTRAGMLLPRNG